MPMYRCYGLGRTGVVKAGAWIDADHDDAARGAAAALIDARTPEVEIWDGLRRVAVVAATPESRLGQVRARRPRGDVMSGEDRLAI